MGGWVVCVYGGGGGGLKTSSKPDDTNPGIQDY